MGTFFTNCTYLPLMSNRALFDEYSWAKGERHQIRSKGSGVGGQGSERVVSSQNPAGSSQQAAGSRARRRGEGVTRGHGK